VWILCGVLCIDINIAAYDQILGSAYIKTPVSIASKHSILNIRNKEDSRCFLYSILAHIYPVRKNETDPDSYVDHLDSLNFAGLSFPLPLNQISKFETLNPTISVSVLYVDPDERTYFPLRATVYHEREHHVNLLLLGDDVSGLHHYTLITDLATLLSSKSKSKKRC